MTDPSRAVPDGLVEELREGANRLRAALRVPEGVVLVEADAMARAADALEAQGRALAEAGWWPIETAPKDGPILIGFWYSNRFVRYIGRWDAGLKCWTRDEVSSAVFPSHMQAWFSHWMPLPPPPSREAGTLADATPENSPSSKDQEIAGLRAALERIARWERYGGEDSKPLVYPVDIAKQALAALSPLDGEA